MNSVNAWFEDLKEINENLDSERRYKFKRVKIAILDTGINMANSAFDTDEAKRRIVKQEDFLKDAGDPSRAEARDMCGHGTHCAGLLRKVAPAADIYVARVAEDFDSDLDDRVVAEVRALQPHAAVSVRLSG